MKTGITFSTFDLFHAGHVKMLEEAKSKFDYLIVGLQLDPSIDRPEKNKPTQSIIERYVQLRGCKYIDEIIPYITEEDLIDVLSSFKIEIRIIGEEYKEKNYPGRVRLKGDRKEHWEDRATSSYKFELDDDVFFMGMNKFSIHKPVMRNYIHEWIFHQMSEELGLVAVNYKFFNVFT